ncbi:MAG: hypothetical protein LIO77_01480 [Rikenellaceae bacterium]|nr:hypothetical protein [Rikenellaceae bacterium]
MKKVNHRFQRDLTIKVSGNVPSNYHELKKIETHNKFFDIEYQYIYADSSMLYISNAKTFTFPNYSNIKNMNSDESILRLEDDDLIVETNILLMEHGKVPLPRASYNMTFGGIDEDGLFWKDIKYGDIYIGYLNVPADKKELFDNSLDSFVIK